MRSNRSNVTRLAITSTTSAAAQWVIAQGALVQVDADAGTWRVPSRLSSATTEVDLRFRAMTPRISADTGTPAGDTGGVDLHGAALSQRRTAGRQREHGPYGRALAQVGGGPADPPMPCHRRCSSRNPSVHEPAA